MKAGHKRVKEDSKLYRKIQQSASRTQPPRLGSGRDASNGLRVVSNQAHTLCRGLRNFRVEGWHNRCDHFAREQLEEVRKDLSPPTRKARISYAGTSSSEGYAALQNSFDVVRSIRANTAA